MQGNPDGFEDIDILFETQGLEGIASLIDCPIANKKSTSSGLILSGKLNDGTDFVSAPIDNEGIDRLVIGEPNLREREGSRSDQWTQH